MRKAEEGRRAKGGSTLHCRNGNAKLGQNSHRHEDTDLLQMPWEDTAMRARPDVQCEEVATLDQLDGANQRLVAVRVD